MNYDVFVEIGIAKISDVDNKESQELAKIEAKRLAFKIAFETCFKAFSSKFERKRSCKALQTIIDHAKTTSNLTNGVKKLERFRDRSFSLRQSCDFFADISQKECWKTIEPLVDQIIAKTTIEIRSRQGSLLPIKIQNAKDYFENQTKLILQEFLEEARRLEAKFKRCDRKILETNGNAVFGLRYEEFPVPDGRHARFCGDLKALFLQQGKKSGVTLCRVGLSLPGGADTTNQSILKYWNQDQTHECEVVDVCQKSIILRFNDAIPIYNLPPSARNGEPIFQIVRMASRITLKRELRALESIIGSRGSGCFKSPMLAPDIKMRDIIISGYTSSNSNISKSCCEVVRPVNTEIIHIELGEDMEKLNLSQKKALILGLSRRVTLIQGPPGTGKTRVACQIIKGWSRLNFRKAIKFGHRGYENSIWKYPCLATAGSNIAVDNLAEGLSKAGLDVIRIGNGGDENSPFLLDTRAMKVLGYRGNCVRQDELRRVQDRLLNTTDVICATCCGVGKDILKHLRFLYVLVDEATQVTEPELLIAISRGCRQLVLVGDPCQLEPTVLSDLARKNLTVSLFDRLVQNGVPSSLLDTQYRMHPAISEFPSSTFYGGKLKNGITSDLRQPPCGFQWPRDNWPIAYIHVESQQQFDGDSIINELEAECVLRTLQMFLNHGIKGEDIGIITPYKAQKRLILKEINKRILSKCGVEVSTVDGFQGREKEIILLSYTRANAKLQSGFLRDWKRSNVMLTRARRGLIVFGHQSTMMNEKVTWAHWICWAKNNGCTFEKNFNRNCYKFEYSEKKKWKALGKQHLSFRSGS